MNIIINLAMLGGMTKTGICRVVGHLAQGMSQHLGDQVTFHLHDNTHGSINYYQQHLQPQGARLAVGKHIKLLQALSRRLEGFISNTTHNRARHYRLARRASVVLCRVIDGQAAKIPGGFFTTDTIYHSPFHQIPSQIRKRHPEVRRFTTIYDLIAITHPEYFKKGLINLVKGIINSLDENDYTLSISAATRDTLLAHSRCNPDRAFVIPLAASDHFHPARDVKANQQILQQVGIPNTNYILSLGTLEVRKNLEIVILAYKQLRDSNALPAGTKLVLVGGNGWKTHKLEQALKVAADYRSDIIMPGFVPDEYLAAVYSSARVFVYMSFLEGFGLPPLEAMQCGTPVITSNTSSLPEVVGEAGIMLEPTDIQGLCSVIEEIFSNDELHASMSAKSLERAKTFSWQRFVQATVRAYETGLGQ